MFESEEDVYEFLCNLSLAKELVARVGEPTCLVGELSSYRSHALSNNQSSLSVIAYLLTRLLDQCGVMSAQEAEREIDAMIDICRTTEWVFEKEEEEEDEDDEGESYWHEYTQQRSKAKSLERALKVILESKSLNEAVLLAKAELEKWG